MAMKKKKRGEPHFSPSPSFLARSYRPGVVRPAGDAREDRSEHGDAAAGPDHVVPVSKAESEVLEVPLLGICFHI